MCSLSALNDAFASVIAVGLRSAISRAQARASSMFRLAQQLSVVDHAVHEPPAERFFRVERLAGQDELECPARPEYLGKEISSAAVDREADAGKAGHELRRAGGDREVAHRHQTEAPARGRAVDRRDLTRGSNHRTAAGVR